MPDREAQHVAARADLCRLTAACYYQPGTEFAEEKVFDAMREAAAYALPSVVPIVERMGADFVRETLETLQIDYAALFLNPGRALAAPYQSVWTAGKDPTIAEQVIASVSAFYAQAGFEIDREFRDLPDHIAAELELLYALIFREARARANDDQAAAETAIELRQTFLTIHLGRWVADFATAMQAGARTPFYASLADLTKRLVDAEGAFPATSPG